MLKSMKSTLPNLGNIHPLDPQVTYPYKERWEESEVQVILACVPWQPDNLPAFTSQAELDAYIDNLPTSRKVEIPQFKNTPPTFAFNCPIPFDVAQEYTYCRVKIQQSAPQKALPYENTQRPIRTYYYFIEDSAYVNPSVTQLTVALDVWHTYFDFIEISGADLKRGHIVNELAPTVSEYLKNPLAHTTYLTTPDYNFGEPADRVNTAEFEQYGGTGKRYLVLWGNFRPSEIGITNGYGYAPTLTPTVPVEFNKDLLLDKEPVWTNGADYEKVLPFPHSPHAQSNTGVPTSVFAFAVDLEDANAFLSALDFHGMHIMNRLQGSAVLPASMIKLGAKHTSKFGTLYPLETPAIPLARYVKRELKAEKWDMPTEIKDFTKAYTYPYAHIVFAMPDGTIRNIQVETLGDGGASYIERLTLGFPWLNAETFLASYKSNGEIQYKFRNFMGEISDVELTAGAWQETLTRYDIPTFTIWRTSYTAYQADNQGAILSARKTAWTNLHNTHRGLTNSWQNTKDSLGANYTNTNNQINTSYTNGIASAQTARDNTIRSADTALANTQAQNATTRANQERTIRNNNDNTNAGNAYTMENGNIEKVAIDRNFTHNKQFARENAGIDNYVQDFTQSVTNEALGTQTLVSAASGIAGGAISGAVMGGPAGLAVGAVGGVVDGAINAINTGITIAKNNALGAIQLRANASKFNAAYGGMYYYDPLDAVGASVDGSGYLSSSYGANAMLKNNVQLPKIDSSVNNSVNLATTQNNNNNATARDVTTNTTNTSNANAQRTRDMTVTNANITYNTTAGILTRSRDTGLDNNKRSYDVGMANNDRSYLNGKINNQWNYETALDNQRHIYNQEALKPNRMQTQNSGDAYKDLDATRGTTIRYAKQTDDALIQVARMWKRYGYSYGARLPRTLTPATSKANTRFPCTFWQLEDITFKKPLQERYREYISSMLAKGITFWHKPDFSETTL